MSSKTKYYCDMCGKEIENWSLVHEIGIDLGDYFWNGYTGNSRYEPEIKKDVCENCRDKIIEMFN